MVLLTHGRATTFPFYISGASRAAALGGGRLSRMARKISTNGWYTATPEERGSKRKVQMRKIIQITAIPQSEDWSPTLFALCDDGSLWYMLKPSSSDGRDEWDWKPVPRIPDHVNRNSPAVLLTRNGSLRAQPAATTAPPALLMPK